MSHNHRQFTTRSGASTLLMVLILTFMLQLSLFSYVIVSRYGIQKALATQYSKQALYAAEGVLQDTFQRFRLSSTWPENVPYTETLTLGGAIVDREVSFDEATNLYTITIQSRYQDAKRKLVATYTRSVADATQTEVPALDVSFVLDVSGSMTPVFDDLKAAVVALVASDAFTDQDRLSIVTYSTQGQVNQPLTFHRSNVIQAVNALSIGGYTNISHGLYLGSEQLDQPDPSGRENVKKIIIFFTDGVANRGISASSTLHSCTSQECLDPASTQGYKPDGQGSWCSDNAITIADYIRTQKNYAIFGVYYLNYYYSSECARVFGSRIVRDIVADPSKTYETDDPDQLKQIFARIGEQATDIRNEGYQFREVAPDED